MVIQGFGFRNILKPDSIFIKRTIGKKMKRFIGKLMTFLALILMVCGNKTQAKEKGQYTVYADPVVLSDQQPSKMMVCIRKNRGIMGFRIKVKYDKDVIQISKVSRGSILNHGNFQDNLGLKNGQFDILWSGTEDMKKNGTLFTLSVQLKKKNVNNSTIELSYSQEDTFNENWEDVSLLCKNIELCGTEDQKENTDSVSKEADENEKELRSEAVNETADQILEQVTMEEFYEKVLDVVARSEDVQDDSQMQSIEFSKLPEQQKKQIAKQILDNYKQITAKNVRKMSEKDQVQVVQKIFRRIEEQKDMKTIQVEKELKKTDQNQENPKRNSRTNKIVMSALAVLVLILIPMVMQWKKRKECGRDE